MNNDDIARELTNLKRQYALELDTLEGRVFSAKASIGKHANGMVSDHDPFNMSATCQNLAVLAGKIKQTENVIRWAAEAARA